MPVFHEDVKVWEVNGSSATGDLVGLWYLDPYARPGKRSGAWATELPEPRDHRRQDATVLSGEQLELHQGCARRGGADLLVRCGDVVPRVRSRAALSLLERRAYPTLNGGVRDYTEFQSQLLERWLVTDEVIEKVPGAPRNRRADPGRSGGARSTTRRRSTRASATTEYLASALLDHDATTPRTRKATSIADAFERDGPGRAGDAATRSPCGIAARTSVTSSRARATPPGYYGYIWADVLTSDAAEAFSRRHREAFYDKCAGGGSLVENLFAVRNAVDPEEAYRAFRGRDAQIDALMRDRGFPVPSKAEENTPDGSGE